MKTLSGGSVRKQLILASVLSSGTALVLVGAAMVGYDALELRRALIRRLSVQADIVGANGVSAILFSDQESAEKTLAAFRADPRVIAASIYADGQRFATYLRDPGMESDLLDEGLNLASGGHRLDRDLLLLSKDLVFEGKTIGRVVVASELTEMKTAMLRGGVLVSVVLAGSLGIAIVISSRLQRRITEPVRRLADVARRVSQDRDYSVRASGAGNEEIDSLILSFNEMLEEIRKQQHELRAAHDKLELRVAERTAQLKAANDELEAFSYSVSHDLRAPLRHIAGFAEMLEGQSASLGEEGRRCLKKISLAATRMGQLIDDLLSFSRIGRSDMQTTPVNLSQLVEEVVREARAEEKVPAEWRLGTLPVVKGDRALLRLVFTNLISNAIKYSSKDAHPRIEVKLAGKEDGEVVVCVSDNGVGFDMAYASKLFGVFQRLHRADEFEGTGIGLANVRRIVHRHGGRTWAEGVPGQGASFYLSLPVEQRLP